MKKNIKAIIAALSASVMCAVPVVASFASTAATASITAEAAGADLIKDATYIASNGGDIVITSGAITYRITGTNTAELYGRYNQVSNVEMADQIRYNGQLYKVTYVRPRAFKNAHRTATGSGVTKFRCGKYVEEIGDEAFYESSVQQVDFYSAQSLRIIGNRAFAYSSVSTQLYIPSSVEEIREGAFRYNRWLETVTLDGGVGSTRRLSIASNAFKDCQELFAVTVYRTNLRNGWNTTQKDLSVFDGTDLDADGVYGVSAGVQRFKQVFLP